MKEKIKSTKNDDLKKHRLLMIYINSELYCKQNIKQFCTDSNTFVQILIDLYRL